MPGVLIPAFMSSFTVYKFQCCSHLGMRTWRGDHWGRWTAGEGLDLITVCRRRCNWVGSYCHTEVFKVKLVVQKLILFKVGFLVRVNIILHVISDLLNLHNVYLQKKILKIRIKITAFRLQTKAKLWKNPSSCNVQLHTFYLFIVRWTLDSVTLTVINSTRLLQATAARGVVTCRVWQTLNCASTFILLDPDVEAFRHLMAST